MGILVLAFAVHLWIVCIQKSDVVFGQNLLNSLNVVLKDGWLKGAEGPNDSRSLPLFSCFHCYCRLCSICAAPQRPQGGDLSVSRISVHNTMSGLQTRDTETLRFCRSLPLSIPIYLWCPAVQMLSISPALLIFSPSHVLRTYLHLSPAIWNPHEGMSCGHIRSGGRRGNDGYHVRQSSQLWLKGGQCWHWHLLAVLKLCKVILWWMWR